MPDCLGDATLTALSIKDRSIVFRSEILHHHEGGEYLTDFIRNGRVVLCILAQSRPFARRGNVGGNSSASLERRSEFKSDSAMTLSPQRRMRSTFKILLKFREPLFESFHGSDIAAAGPRFRHPQDYGRFLAGELFKMPQRDDFAIDRLHGVKHSLEPLPHLGLDSRV